MIKKPKQHDELPTLAHRAILQAWESAFSNTPVVYLSGPITTGLRYVRSLRAGRNSAEDKLRVFQENNADLLATAARLRAQRGEIIVEPASLNIADWSQRDYLNLWEQFIERHVKLVLFMTGWEYSVGCASEFARAAAHDVRTETVAGSILTIDDALALLTSACEKLRNQEKANYSPDLEVLTAKLTDVASQIEGLRKPRTEVVAGKLRKDTSLDLLAESMNVAQFVSFSPQKGKPKQEYARLAGRTPNVAFPNVRTAIESLLYTSTEKSVNVRSYEPSSPQSREFIYGLTSVPDAVAAVERLTREGLHTIVNETIDVHDGGVSGVLMGDILEFAPDDTPRCVEKPGTASLPRGWGRELLSTVYGIPVELDAPLASRLEFSIHPGPRGWRKSNILAWEFSEQIYVDAKPKIRWPNRFSTLIGDKTFGLLVAHNIGLPVPYTTVINRRVAPFSFGRPTCSGELWIRTAPREQVPGKFTTHHGWLDPFKLLNTEDPEGNAVVSVLSQQGVSQSYSGALIVGRDGNLIVEGKVGEGESLMLGAAAPEMLPEKIEADVRAVYTRADAALGPVRFEWVHDGDQVWIVQLHAGATDTMQDYITSKTASHWQSFDVRAGLEELRKAVATLPPDTGITLSGRVGLTSHFADVIRRANVAARMG